MNSTPEAPEAKSPFQEALEYLNVRLVYAPRHIKLLPGFDWAPWLAKARVARSAKGTITLKAAHRLSVTMLVAEEARPALLAWAAKRAALEAYEASPEWAAEQEARKRKAAEDLARWRHDAEPEREAVEGLAGSLDALDACAGYSAAVRYTLVRIARLRAYLTPDERALIGEWVQLIVTGGSVPVLRRFTQTLAARHVHGRRAHPNTARAVKRRIDQARRIVWAAEDYRCEGSA
jgi:hypothetical protein